MYPARMIFAFAFISIACAGTLQAGSLQGREGWQVRGTSLPFSELVERVKSAIKAEKMGLVTQASASAGARGQGIQILGNQVLGVYRNDFARRMLKASVAAGMEAPIRFYVTEEADGSATLSWKTPTFVFAPYLKEGGRELETLAKELDQVFEAIARRAVAR